MFPLLLAADVGNWIGLAVLVLTVLGWIVNAIKGNDPDGKPLPQRPRPKRDLRSEIDVFLEELQQRPAEPRKEAPRPAPQPPRETSERPRGDKPRKSNPQQPKAAKSKSPKPTAPKPAASQPGQGIREHVSTYMAGNRVAAEVQQHLAHRVDEAVQRDLSGGTVAPVQSVSSPVAAPHPLMAMLLRPEGVRQAILLNEILQRPRVLRDRLGTRS